MNKLLTYLNQQLVGRVYDQPEILTSYSHSRSPLSLKPRMVALPESTSDISLILKLIDRLAQKDYYFPVTTRGSGLDYTGASLTNHLLLSTEKLNSVPEIDVESRLVRVQAGVPFHKLENILGLHGLKLPIIAHPDQTIGSIVNSTAPTTHHRLLRQIEKLEVVLPAGDIVQLAPISRLQLSKLRSNKTPEAKLYQKLFELSKKFSTEITRLKHLPISARGYHPAVLAYDHHFNPIPFFFASQGSLGVVTEVIFRCEPLHNYHNRLFIRFKQFKELNHALPKLLKLHPTRADLYDLELLSHAKDFGYNFNVFGRTGFILVLDYDLPPVVARLLLSRILKSFKNSTSFQFENTKNRLAFRRLDNLISSYNNHGSNDPVGFFQDFFVPFANLDDFMLSLSELLTRYHCFAPLTGSLLSGTFSLHPKFSYDIKERQAALKLFQEFSSLIHAHEGQLASFTPEGRTKAIFTNTRLLGPEKAFYEAIKAVFDPRNILNPEIKLGATPRRLVQYLRETPPPGLIK